MAKYTLGSDYTPHEEQHHQRPDAEQRVVDTLLRLNENHEVIQNPIARVKETKHGSTWGNIEIADAIVKYGEAIMAVQVKTRKGRGDKVNKFWVDSKIKESVRQTRKNLDHMLIDADTAKLHSSLVRKNHWWLLTVIDIPKDSSVVQQYYTDLKREYHRTASQGNPGVDRNTDLGAHLLKHKRLFLFELEEAPITKAKDILTLDSLFPTEHRNHGRAESPFSLSKEEYHRRYSGAREYGSRRSSRK